MTRRQQRDEMEFRRGYYLAVAELARQLDQPTAAAELLRLYGPVDWSGIDPVDLATLEPIAPKSGGNP